MMFTPGSGAGLAIATRMAWAREGALGLLARMNNVMLRPLRRMQFLACVKPYEEQGRGWSLLVVLGALLRQIHVAPSEPLLQMVAKLLVLALKHGRDCYLLKEFLRALAVLLSKFVVKQVASFY